MKSLKHFSQVLVLLAVFIAGCKTDPGKKEDSTQMNTEDKETSVRDPQKTETMNAEGNGDVVEFQVLKDALPETMAGLIRTTHTGQKSTFSNMQVSNAQAEYSDGDRRINATITDTGGMSTVMAGIASWSNYNMKNETKDGYQRTTTIYGHKALEKYNSVTDQAEIAMIYNDRFVVTLNAHKVSIKDLREVLGNMEIKG